MISTGEILALLIAKGFEGHVGPCGGRDPNIDGNEMVLYSQLPECGYRFNDDGSVDCFYPDEDAMYESLVQDCGLEEEDARETVDHPAHYNSVMALLESDDGWFMYFMYDNPELVIAIQEVLKHQERKNQDE